VHGSRKEPQIKETVMTGRADMLRRSAAPAIIALVLGACSTTSSVGPPHELSGTSWAVASIDGRSTGRVPELTADFTVDGRVNGDSGCNSYSGPYIQTGTTVRIGELLSTRRACGDDDRQQQESRLLRIMQGASRIEHERDGRISLHGQSGTVMLAPLRLSTDAPGLRGRTTYDCDGVALTVGYDEDEAAVTWSGGHDELDRRVTDSGFWYESGNNTLRGRDDNLTWTQNGRSPRLCEQLR
jgi:heat shock protein HslJ